MKIKDTIYKNPNLVYWIYASVLESWLKEFLLAVARTVLSATMKYAAPATAIIAQQFLETKNSMKIKKKRKTKWKIPAKRNEDED